MNNLLQNHGAKFICKVPDGLRELCTDISREVLRAQPFHIYNFIAEYVEGLRLTRENAKIAVKFVDSIMADSEGIVNLLNRCGLDLKEIAAIAPKLQGAFRDYVDATDCTCSITSDVCVEEDCNEENELTITKIVENAGVTLEVAERAAVTIQRAFLQHYKRITQCEFTSEASWKTAVMNTIEILRKFSLSERAAVKTARSIESKYHEYYTRRDEMKSYDAAKNEGDGKKNGFPRTNESIQAVAGLNMMYDSGITREQANRAATIIQRIFREYRSRKNSSLHPSTSTGSMAAREILDNLHQRIFDKVISGEAIPGEFGTIQEIAKATEKLSNAYEERLDGSKLSLDNAKSSEEETVEEDFKADNEHLHD
ncbi:uncharacterized protein LOC107043760 [Diachasma alloeum]|uniref:uncharacterized protein LOC107043760 n=1 Tax=Diachasma alloeum TaxID=454923 RepID=UPI0007381C38|nr:uncharacterized protein LOC107043760 [Diachasma alloeum]